MRGLILLLALICTACAPAPQRPERPDPESVSYASFDAADADHSGKLTREESAAMPFVARHFAAMDTDSNALVSWQEMRNFLIAGPVRGARTASEPSPYDR